MGNQINKVKGVISIALQKRLLPQYQVVAHAIENSGNSWQFLSLN